MTTKFRNLKNQIDSFEKENPANSGSSNRSTPQANTSSIANRILLFAFLATFAFYIGSSINFGNTNFFSTNPVSELIESINQPDEDLLNRMGAWMAEMGYGELTHEQLTDLRNSGVTATNTSALRDLGYTSFNLQDLKDLGEAGVRASFVQGMQEAGYTGLTKEELVNLERADVSATFTRMMKELGYTDLTVYDLIRLRNNDVTAYFTSNMHDLGYTDLTKEDLIRLKGTGVSISMVEQLIQQRGQRPSLDEIIRYRISNQ